MPSSWSESNKMHSTNRRVESAEEQIREFDEPISIRDNDKYEGDYENDAPDDSYLDGEFVDDYQYEEPPDHYIDAAYEDRYYIEEPFEYDYGY